MCNSCGPPASIDNVIHHGGRIGINTYPLGVGPNDTRVAIDIWDMDHEEITTRMHISAQEATDVAERLLKNVKQTKEYIKWQASRPSLE